MSYAGTFHSSPRLGAAGRSSIYGYDRVSRAEAELIEYAGHGPLASLDCRPLSNEVFVAHSVAQETSRIEQMMLASQALSKRRSRLLGILLQSAQPNDCGGDANLKPLWATEAMHRAYQMVYLVHSLDCKPAHRRISRADADNEARIARRLTGTIHSLRIEHDTERLHCSGPLRDAVRDVVELFGDVAGIELISTSIERLELPSYKRRALILLAMSFVVDTLLEGARARSHGKISIALDRANRSTGRLVMSYEADIALSPCVNGSSEIMDDLSSLLETDIRYSRGNRLCVAEILLPLS